MDDVLDVDSPVVTVLEVVLDSLAFVADHDDDLVNTGSFDCFDDVLQQWFVSNWEHRFGSCLGKWAKPGSLTSSENDCFHCNIFLRVSISFLRHRFFLGELNLIMPLSSSLTLLFIH